METENGKQKELFEEFKGQGKGMDKLRQKYGSSKRPFINISIENFVFASIIAIMAIVLAFSLGVERGKRIGGTKPAPLEKPIAKKIEPIKEVVKEAEVIEDVAPVTTDANYTIQIATYRDEAIAKKKAESLKKEGYAAFVIPQGDLYPVCIGRYRTVEESKPDLQKLKRQYTDCFTRKITRH